MHLTVRVEGTRLGHTAIFQCPVGFRINGTANLTCQASGELPIAFLAIFGTRQRLRQIHFFGKDYLKVALSTEQNVNTLCSQELVSSLRRVFPVDLS